jgi:hypothetical protein
MARNVRSYINVFVLDIGKAMDILGQDVYWEQYSLENVENFSGSSVVYFVLFYRSIGTAPRTVESFHYQ